MRSFNLDIECVITRDGVPPKPSKEPVLKACECMHLSPGDVVIIGDYEFDMVAGKRAGTATILLRASKESTSENADLEIDSLRELIQILS